MLITCTIRSNQAKAKSMETKQKVYLYLDSLMSGKTSVVKGIASR